MQTVHCKDVVQANAVVDDETGHHAAVSAAVWGYSPGDAIDDCCKLLIFALQPCFDQRRFPDYVRKIQSMNGPAQLLKVLAPDETRLVLKVVNKSMIRADDYFLDLEALHFMRESDQ
jgi:hypothetical protein